MKLVLIERMLPSILILLNFVISLRLGRVEMHIKSTHSTSIDHDVCGDAKLFMIERMTIANS